MTAEYLSAIRQPDQQVNPLFANLGIELLALNHEGAELRCHVRRGLIQGAGVLSGGIMATVADEAMAHAVLIRLEPRQRTATVEMSVRYLRPVLENDLLTVKAWVLKKGRSIVTAEAECRDGRGRLAAKAAASFMVLG